MGLIFTARSLNSNNAPMWAIKEVYMSDFEGEEDEMSDEQDAAIWRAEADDALQNELDYGEDTDEERWIMLLDLSAVGNTDGHGESYSAKVTTLDDPF